MNYDGSDPKLPDWFHWLVALGLSIGVGLTLWTLALAIRVILP